MIRKLIARLAHIPENDREVKKIHDRTQKRLDTATVVLRRVGKMQEILVQKTTTFYIARAVGGIK